MCQHKSIVWIPDEDVAQCEYCGVWWKRPKAKRPQNFPDKPDAKTRQQAIERVTRRMEHTFESGLENYYTSDGLFYFDSVDFRRDVEKEAQRIWKEKHKVTTTERQESCPF